jgi:F420-dependent oxidoreductase-like protein
MELRVFTEPQQGASYEQLVSVAKAAEELGFDGFFRSDHYLKMGAASGLPACTDAWATLAGLARDTQRIRLGTLVTPVTFRPPGAFAVVVTQVDHMSGGRVEVGLGAGWYEAEHEAYGLGFPPVATRYDMLEDQLRILHGAWSTSAGQIFEYNGHTCSVHIDPEPLVPAQKPHPPIIMGGGAGPRNARLAATYADEFNAPFVPPARAAEAFAKVRDACKQAGRDAATMTFSVANTLCCARNEIELRRRADATGRSLSDLSENAIAGTPSQVAARLREYAAAGAKRAYLQVLDLYDLGHLRLIAEEVLPEVS